MNIALKLKMEKELISEEFEEKILTKDKIIYDDINELITYENITEKEKELIQEAVNVIEKVEKEELMEFGEENLDTAEGISSKIDILIQNKTLEETVKLFKKVEKIVRNFEEFLPETLEPKGVKSMFFRQEIETEKIILYYTKVILELSQVESEMLTLKIKALKEATRSYELYNEGLYVLRELMLYKFVIDRKLKEMYPRIELLKDPEEVFKFNNIVKILNGKEEKIKKNIVELMEQMKNAYKKEKEDTECSKKLQNFLANSVPTWKKRIVNSFDVVKLDNVPEYEENTKENSKWIINLKFIRKLNKELFDELKTVIKGSNI